jgi:aminoglycoside phosphotransferase (APT) family kinase protein
MTAKKVDLGDVQSRLKVWFDVKMPWASELSLSGLKMDTVGGSNETFFLDIRYREGGTDKLEKLILRWPPLEYPTYPKYDMKEQFLTMKHLKNTGVPAPGARWLEEDESVIGRPFYVVDKIEGWIPNHNPPYQLVGPIHDATPEVRTKVWRHAIDVIAKINTIDWMRDGFHFLGVPKAGTDPIDQQIAYYEKLLGGYEEPPPSILLSSMGWLKNNHVVPKHVSLCWGDARLGNLVFRKDEVVGVLDWEMACIGDSESDLAWFLNLDMNQYELLVKPLGHPRLEGLPEKEETIAYYEQVTKRKVVNIHYHEVFAVWRMAVTIGKLETTLRLRGYDMPDSNLNRFNFERLGCLIG